jgi:hypothetical protein
LLWTVRRSNKLLNELGAIDRALHNDTYRAVARWIFQPVTITLGDEPPRSRTL